MRTFSWLMVFVVLVGSIYAEGKEELVVESAKELMEISAKMITWEKDGSKMVLIPAGDFLRGLLMETMMRNQCIPSIIDAFYMDKYEVTNAQYQLFMQDSGHRPPAYWNDSIFNSPQQPVVGVNWSDATAYAVWAGKRLPTEAEWEKSAKSGLSGKKYPWADTIDSSKSCYDQGRNGKPTPVGSYVANSYSLYNMAGNAWEWCSDWYDPDYYSTSPSHNPKGPSAGSYSQGWVLVQQNGSPASGSSRRQKTIES